MWWRMDDFYEELGGECKYCNPISGNVLEIPYFRRFDKMGESEMVVCGRGNQVINGSPGDSLRAKELYIDYKII